MSATTTVTVMNEATLRFTAGYAALTSVTFSMVASAPTPLYRLYQETLGLTPLEITLIFAIYSPTMVAAFLTVARLSDFVGRKPMILAALGHLAQKADTVFDRAAIGVIAEVAVVAQAY